MTETGLVHVYTGNGKGKTTAAMGLGIRAYGSGMKVLLIQFLKSGNTSELEVLKKLEPDFSVQRGFNCKKFSWNMSPQELEAASKEASEIFENVKNTAMTGQYDMIILDEILGTLSLGFISEASVIDFIKSKPEKLELVLTGRNAPAGVIQSADYVSEIKAVKHPYEKGIPARKGIEF